MPHFAHTAAEPALYIARRVGLLPSCCRPAVAYCIPAPPPPHDPTPPNASSSRARRSVTDPVLSFLTFPRYPTLPVVSPRYPYLHLYLAAADTAPGDSVAVAVACYTDASLTEVDKYLVLQRIRELPLLQGQLVRAGMYCGACGALSALGAARVVGALRSIEGHVWSSAATSWRKGEGHGGAPSGSGPPA